MVPRETLLRLFAIDLRTLAVARMAVGALVFVDLANRFPLIPWFYADSGLLPRVLISLEPFPGPALWSGTVAYQQGLLLVGMAAALGVVAGRAARAATFVCWITLLSLWWRNPGFGNAGDLILIQLLFWFMFLPTARVWTLGGRREPDAPPRSRVLSVASAGLVLQMPFVYFFSALQKLAGSGWLEGTVTWYAVSREAASRTFGLFLRDHVPAVLDALTYVTLTLEFVGPLLLFLPRSTPRVRLAMFLAFASLQLGLSLSLRLWLFPFISIVALVPILPGFVFDRMTGAAAEPAAGPILDGLPQAVRLKQAISILLSVCIAYVVFSNIQRQTDWIPPSVINRAGRLLGLNQGWLMYANEAPWDYRLLIRGKWNDRTAWIDDWDQTATWPPMAKLRETYRGKRYLERQPNQRARSEMHGIALWVCRSWNRERTGGEPLREVELVGWTRRFYRDGRPAEIRQRPIARLGCRSGMRRSDPEPDSASLGGAERLPDPAPQ